MSPQPQWKLTSSGRRVHEELDARLTSSPKRTRGKDRKPGAHGRGEEARAGRGAEGAGPGLAPGPDSLLLPNSRTPRNTQPPEASAAPGRPEGARQWREKSVALLVTEIWGR